MMSDGAAYFPETLAGRSDMALTKSHSYSVDGAGGPSSVPAQCNKPTDEFLLTEAGKGSKDSLAGLFRRHRRTVLNVARRILRDDSEAEDLCQEVFLFLFQNGQSFDAGKGTALSWIIQITYHRAMNRRKYLAFRQHYTAQEFNEEQIDTRYPRFIDEIAGRTLLNRLREKLSAEQQQTLELHFFEGYSLREIAEKTNQTLGNTRNYFYRGLERLRSCVLPQRDVWRSPLGKGRGRGIACWRAYTSYIAQVAEVTATKDRFHVDRVVSVVDCGQVLNSSGVKAQIEGGCTMGLSAALREAITIRNGVAQEQNFNSYHLLRMPDAPTFETYLADSNREPGGIGELGITLAAPIVANAVFAATGKRLKRLPFRLDEASL
jgi:RNA polymerase sigma-70 factor, ECF subfamily